MGLSIKAQFLELVLLLLVGVLMVVSVRIERIVLGRCKESRSLIIISDIVIGIAAVMAVCAIAYFSRNGILAVHYILLPIAGAAIALAVSSAIKTLQSRYRSRDKK